MAGGACKGGPASMRKSKGTLPGCGNDPVKEFGGRKNPWDTGTRVGTGPTEIKTFHVFRDIVGSKPGALGQNGFELKSGADVRVEPGFEVGRGEEKFADEMFPEAGND